MFVKAPNVRSLFSKIGVSNEDMAKLKDVNTLEQFADQFNNIELSLPFRLMLKMVFCFINFGFVDHETREDILCEFFFTAKPSLEHFNEFYRLVNNFWKEKKLCCSIENEIFDKLSRKETISYSLVNSLLLFDFPFQMTRSKKLLLEPFLCDSFHFELTKAKIARALRSWDSEIFLSIPYESSYDVGLRKRNFFFNLLTNLEC